MVTQINGVAVRVFCGPATALVTVGGQELRFEDGACELVGETFTVNLGTWSAGDPPKPDYLGLTVLGATEGGAPADQPAIAWVKDGVDGALALSTAPTLTISPDRSRVEFSGTAMGTGEPVSGSIAC